MYAHPQALTEAKMARASVVQWITDHRPVGMMTPYKDYAMKYMGFVGSTFLLCTVCYFN